MTTDLEEQLSAGMREHTAGLALSGDVLGRATRNHRRRAATVRAGYALGVAGLAGVLAAGLTLGGGGGANDPAPKAAPPSVAQAQTPSLRLAAAAAASDDISYRIRLSSGAKGAQPLVYEGAFDPRTDTGYLRSTQEAGVLTELLIDGTRYIGTERIPGHEPEGEHERYGRYAQYPGRYDRLSYDLSEQAVLGSTTADPASLFRALQAANATISQNPDGTLHFRIVQQSATDKIVQDGDVTLDANGRIARIAIAGTWESTAKGRLDKGEFTTTLELSDYGLAVTAQRPADVVPAN
ncbi:hypothetical protein [Dactylosporangium darangshiense]|uniref:Uncharacterized protein n=1 Tax=Dactylosporangium darangshiense TaxID=579108 RepID=A0ABP8DIX7_9ACTN